MLLLLALLGGDGRLVHQAPGAAEAELRRHVERASSEIRRFYRARGGRPAWSGSAEAAKRGRELRETLADAAREGLSPADYPDSGAPADSARPESVAAWEVAQTRAALRLALDLSSGRVDPDRINTLWSRAGPRLDVAASLATALDSTGPRRALEAFAPSHSGYAGLRAALQYYRNLASAGGWPALPPGPVLGDSGSRVAVLRQRLAIEADASPDAGRAFDAVLDSAVRLFQRRHGLAPDGAVGRETLAELNVPVRDRVPQLELNLERWRWLPRGLGPRYVMVNVASRRTLSHGCVRVERAPELAVCLLDGVADWLAESLRTAMARPEPRRVMLAKPVPVYLCYWTAWIAPDGALTFGRDVYGWDRRLASALAGTRPPG